MVPRWALDDVAVTINSSMDIILDIGFDFGSIGRRLVRVMCVRECVLYEIAESVCIA